MGSENDLHRGMRPTVKSHGAWRSSRAVDEDQRQPTGKPERRLEVPNGPATPAVVKNDTGKRDRYYFDRKGFRTRVVEDPDVEHVAPKLRRDRGFVEGPSEGHLRLRYSGVCWGQSGRPTSKTGTTGRTGTNSGANSSLFSSQLGGSLASAQGNPVIPGMVNPGADHRY